MMKILHVVAGMNRGGMENWLIEVLRRADRDRYRFDFTTRHNGRPQHYHEEMRSLGVGIIPIVYTPVGLAYRRCLADFRRILNEHGPYDCVQTHLALSQAPFLKVAAEAGVPIRISHSHSLQRRTRHGPIRWLVRRYYRRLIQQYMTVGLGCSRDACGALCGRGWDRDPRVKVLYQGIDMTAYRSPDRSAARREMGLADSDVVVGHAGRFVVEKNHVFLVEVAAHACRLRGDLKFVLMGDGKLRPQIEADVRARGLADRVIFTGLRNDVPQLMAGLDLVVFPSLHEGLPRTLVEAQANGLPILVSTNVPSDVEIIDGICTWMDLSAGASAWADRVVALAGQPAPVDRATAFECVNVSPFNIEESVRQMLAVYDEAAAEVKR